MIEQLISDLQASPDGIKLLLAGLAMAALWTFASRRKAALARADTEADAAKGQAGAYEAQLAEVILDLRRAHDSLEEARIENARLETSLEMQHRGNAENLRLLNENGERLKGEFRALASQVMDTHGEKFERQNAERLKLVLQPLKEHIGQFEAELRGVHEAAGKDRVALKAEIDMLTQRSLAVSEEAHNLTQALKGDAQKQGAWGEMVLASILDRSGLREGEEYEVQVHHRGENGQAFRPDVVVNLPGGRRLVVDSKVSLVAYERAMTADSDGAKAVALKAHVASVKTHIDTLSAKKYHAFDDGAVDYVIMFMPIESAFAEAVKTREDLVHYASERNVLIASPTNLMMALKTVENLWSVERRNKNAMEIARQAGGLYDKFVGFIGNLEKVGTALDTAQKAQADAMKQLTSGKGNLTARVEGLKKLGARTEKQLAQEFDDSDPPQIGKEPPN